MSELSLNQNTLIIYTTPWCGDCRRVKQLLNDHKIPYIEINIDQDPQAAQFVEAINEGYRSVPTLVFPDGTTLTEPSNPELLAAITKLGNVNSIMVKFLSIRCHRGEKMTQFTAVKSLLVDTTSPLMSLNSLNNFSAYASSQIWRFFSG